MTDRFFIAMCAAGALVSQAPMPVVAQTDTDHRTVPRTSWGAPDLQGVWNNNVSTPMERPDEFADRAFLSAEERTAYTAQRHARIATAGRAEGPTPMSAARTTPTGTPCREPRSAARHSFWIPRLERFLP